MNEARWAVTDPFGSKIILKTKTYSDHILSDHFSEDVELRQKLEPCAKETLKAPALVMEDIDDNGRYLYYGVIALEGVQARVKMLKVVVDTDRVPSQVVTWTVLRRGDKILEGRVVYGQGIQHLSG